MENLEEMAQLAVRQGFLDMRMKELKARLDGGEAPEPLREEFKKCFEESQRISERLALHYQRREKALLRLKTKRVKEVKSAAKENAGL